MKWVKFTKLNGSSLYLRFRDIYKVVRVKNTGNLHIYTVQGTTYECESMNDSMLLSLLEKEI